jgi:DNA-binding response OmpR family regulator
MTETKETTAKKKILIAEDEENVRRVLKMVLSAENYEVGTVADGQDALDKIAADAPDLLITDLSMPRIDGSQLCSIIKSSSKYHGIKVIICSALQQSMANEKLNDLPADDYIVKPVDINVLLEKVRALLGTGTCVPQQE